MSTKKIILNVFFLFALVAQLSAQGRGGEREMTAIKGFVVVANDEPVPFANIALFRVDSSLVGGSTSDMDGKFSTRAKPGNYYIEITFLSYQTKVVDDIVKKPGEDVLLGRIQLEENAQMLDEVVVEAERSTMEFKLDKRVFNVGSDLSNAGGNAADIIQNVPSVDVDIEGNVSLRGSENVRILIDGKQSGLVGDGNADALRLIQGDMIDKIEVITNPSSKYEAEGEVGILNIVLKKEKQKGFNGSFEARVGYPDNYGGSFSVNYRRKWINMFASSGLNYRMSPGRGSSYQTYDGPDTTYTFERLQNHTRGGLSSVNRAGADIFINDKNTITAAVLYKYSDGDNHALLEYNDINAEDVLVSSTLRDERERELSQDLEFSLNHVKTFDKKEHKLVTDVRMNINEDGETANLVQTISTTSDAISYQRSSNTEDQRTYLMQTDYTRPIGKDGKFETGARVSLREIENFYSVDLRNSDSADWRSLTDFTDNLTYTENIYAAYALYGNEWKRFSYQAGIRAEYTDIRTVLELSGLENPREYLNFFPSAHVNYELNECNSLQLSYSRRLSRPSFRELIPFYSYTDPRFFYGGNPDLNPEYTDSYEAGFLRMFKKGSFLGSVYYRHTADVVQRITTTDSTSLIRTYPINLGTQDAYGVEANLNLDITKWWRINASGNAYYAVIQGDYREDNFNTELLTFMGRANTNMSLPKDVDLQVSVRYRAPRNTPQGRRLAVTTMDAGLARDFFKGKGTLVFNVRDIFNSGIRRSIIDTEYLYSESDFQWRVRQFTLTFNYRINQRKQRGGRGEGTEGGMDDGGY